MSIRVKPSQLPKAIDNFFGEYVESVYASVAQSADETGEETVNILKATSPKNRGKYAKSWKLKRTEYGNGVTVTVYNTKYRLTHLLEEGHMTRDGVTRAKAIPHIAPAEKKASEMFAKKIKLKVGANK